MTNSNTLVRFSLFLVSVFFFNLSVHAQPVKENDLTELKNTLERFNQAFKLADVDTLDTLLAADYTHTNSGSKAFGKQSWLNWIRSRQEDTRSGVLKYTDYRMLDLEVKMFNDIAIVTGRNLASGINKQKPFTVDIRFTHVWIKQNHQWLRAAFHDAPAK